jgi:hypothetical protein
MTIQRTFSGAPWESKGYAGPSISYWPYELQDGLRKVRQAIRKVRMSFIENWFDGMKPILVLG